LVKLILGLDLSIGEVRLCFHLFELVQHSVEIFIQFVL